MARPPSPGDDATPFLLRVYVKPAPFRPVSDFEPDSRPVRDEFKLHLWKTNTLRDVAQMLYEADPSLSTPLALHAFRVIYFDSPSKGYMAKDVGIGITRVPLDKIQDLLADLDGVDTADMIVDAECEAQDPQQNNHSKSTNNASKTGKRAEHPSSKSILGFEKLSQEIDEEAANLTLGQLKIHNGDFLDCVIRHDPTLASAPSITTSLSSSNPRSRESRVSR